MLEALVFVHLSDIHFQTYRNRSIDLDADLRNELILDAISMQNHIPRVDGIIVTGDVAYRGQREEYETSSEWLSVLCQKLTCKPENVWVIPGNHDVHRSIARGSKVIKSIHNDLHNCDPQYIDSVLADWMGDSEGMDALFRPIEAFNEFSSKFGCSSTPKSVHWTDDLSLNDGSVLRLYGINSTLASGTLDDEKGKLVVGSFQSGNLLREAGVVYLSLCHHPCDWLLDGDTVSDGLNTRASLQLFGHKHRKRLTAIDQVSLIVGAGAVQPSRSEAGWQPAYNFISLYVATEGADRTLIVTVWPRIWLEDQRKFSADFDDAGCPSREFKLRLPKWQAREQLLDNREDNFLSQGSKPKDNADASTEMNNKDKQTYTERRLIFRFLSLPYSRIVRIASALDLVSDDDSTLSEPARKQSYFLRAKERDALDQLRELVERNHIELHPY